MPVPFDPSVPAKPAPGVEGVSLDRIAAITGFTESRNNPDAVSPKGALGVMQIMPATGRDPGFGVRPWDGTPKDNLRFGKDYLRVMLQRYGSLPKMWAAYNWGPGNVDKYGDSWARYAPKETRKYVAKNMAALGLGG